MGRRKARINSRSRHPSKWKTFSCEKIRYESKRSAEMAADLQGEKHGTDLSVYKCRGCLGFHLTSG